MIKELPIGMFVCLCLVISYGIFYYIINYKEIELK